MNEAEKYKRKTIKTIEIDGIQFKIRKLNPIDSSMMAFDLPSIEYKKVDGEFELDKKGEKIPLPFDRKILQEVGLKETRIMLTRAVLEPRIVDKPIGKEESDEVPYDLIDVETSTKLGDIIAKFSYSVFEDEEVGVIPFLEETSGKDVNDDSIEHENTPLDIGG